MSRFLNISGWLLLLAAVVLMSIFEHHMGISRFWALPIAAVGGVLLTTRFFLRERCGEEV